MEGLGQDPGILRRLIGRIERDRGEARDEHDLQIRIEFARAPRKLDAIHLRHHDIGKEQGEGLFLQALVGFKPVAEGYDVVPSLSERLYQEAAHVLVVLGEEYPLNPARVRIVRHHPSSPFSGYALHQCGKRLTPVAIKSARPRHHESQIIASYSVSHKTEHA